MATNVSTADAWQVESMRVTAFPGDVVALENLSWWNDAVGVPPEAVVSRPKAGQYTANGDFEGRRISLQIQPGRIDWNVGPLTITEDEVSIVSTVGPFSETVALLSKIVGAWLPSAPLLQRLAFGVILLQPVENGRAGYALLQKYLHSMRLDLEEASDFLLQINRPRRGRTQSLNINRLARWSVLRAQRMTLTIGAGGAEARTLGEEFACRLELDINTAPDAGVLQGGQLGALFQELIDLAREIAEKGDVR